MSANSFLATGGDNFRALTLGSNTQDTGFTDLQATVDYLDEYANVAEGDAPLPVDYSQHGVGAKVPAGPFSAGQTVTIPLDSLSMTGAGDLTDTSVTVSFDGEDIWAPATVTSDLPTTPYDVPGSADVSIELPAGLSGGAQWFTLTGDATGTVAHLPVTVMADTTPTPTPTPQPTATTVTGTDTSVQWAKAGSVAVSVAPAAATGTVELYDGTTRLGTATLAGGAASVALAAKSLEVGTHTLVVKYLGSSTHAASQGTVTVTVTKAKPKVKVEKPKKIEAGEKAKIKVRVVTEGYEATGKVRIVLKGAGRTITTTKRLSDGDLVARIKVGKPGKYKVTVTYLGDEHTLRGTDKTRLRVKK